VSGSIAKTATAPIERVKLLIQTQDANPKVRLRATAVLPTRRDALPQMRAPSRQHVFEVASLTCGTRATLPLARSPSLFLSGAHQEKYKKNGKKRLKKNTIFVSSFPSLRVTLHSLR
jgi:hypothetical protein